MTVYLLHFREPYGKRALGHYLGATRLSLPECLRRHEEGRGAALLRAVRQSGGSWIVTRVWKRKTRAGAFHLEMRLKAKKRNLRRLCPLCVRHEMEKGL